MYGTGSDVLGVLIARASGQPLERFVQERIFEPLGMKDTAFSVPAAKLDDYAAFGQMMLNQGRHGTERILSRLSVEAITTDQLTPEQKAASGFFPGFFDDRGWGLGVSILTRRDDVAAVPGRFGWDGGLGTSCYSDPKEDMVTLLMTQRAWTSASPPNVALDFWTSAYAAIDD